jgi:histidyl-tRNA synthetase
VERESCPEPRLLLSPIWWRPCGGGFIDAGYEEVIVPSIWEQRPFVEKGGREIVSQMYAFDDKKGRAICLVPEITALIQETWRKEWQKRASGPRRVFYAARCFRYERPQKGRYREFTQVGVELLGGVAPEDRREVEALLRSVLDRVGVRYDFDEAVVRGLGYYLDEGFEASCGALGAQKQIAGGGRYAEGVGFAIGVDRLLLALAEEEKVVKSSG